MIKTNVEDRNHHIIPKYLRRSPLVPIFDILRSFYAVAMSNSRCFANREKRHKFSNLEVIHNIVSTVIKYSVPEWVAR